MLDAALLKLLAWIGLGCLVILAPIGLVIGHALRQEHRLQTATRRALERGTPRQGVIAVCHGLHGSAWVFDVQVEDARGRGMVRVEQMVPKWVASALSPGRQALVRIDPEVPTHAAFDLAAMGWSLPG